MDIALYHQEHINPYGNITLPARGIVILRDTLEVNLNEVDLVQRLPRRAGRRHLDALPPLS